MALSARTPCKLELKPVGWWLTFPDDPQSGLLLTDVAEQIEFARDCDLDLDPSELESAWAFAGIEDCPPKWSVKAKLFKRPIF